MKETYHLEASHPNKVLTLVGLLQLRPAWPLGGGNDARDAKAGARFLEKPEEEMLLGFCLRQFFVPIWGNISIFSRVLKQILGSRFCLRHLVMFLPYIF